MSTDRTITLFHSPQCRSVSVLTLLEELGAPYELKVLNMKAGEQRKAPYLAINPLGKVPAILHGDALVTEQVAIFIYLADLFPEARLAPALGDASRGPYLRWLVYYAACYEPALVDKAMKRDPAPPSTSPYGDFDSMIGTLTSQLQPAPYLLGATMSAADVLWGIALHWGMMFKLVPETPILCQYAERICSRPSFVNVSERDVALAAEHAAALKGA
ncbi:glutathione S-transferase [Paraburkholderia ginsengiterrae]|uniref:Glutathione S-transferase n=1 Tax=Paraburkholderia ginsengiterrae TaxID=1462993 RepID=A0A1A9N491_9BURK|nr:glutathione S-transferase family protein [Paraburkholderia ginsengiterrae]OAJ55966.1 glutathione S-transferase [Paraburkholderia ginsengiterrae]OAJ58575.1 glutathione S-transferase [Paraburkholderia ginsengiterrae]